MDFERIRYGTMVAVGIVAGFWASLELAVQVLFALMVLDVFTGVLVAGKGGKISSDAFWWGITRRKLVTWAIVAAAYIAQPMLGNLPAGTVVAGAYCVAEFLSIIENAGQAGVWVPGILKEALLKLHEQAGASDAQGGTASR